MRADGRHQLPKPIPSSPVPNTVTLNFEGGADDIPTYSLADLRACAERGDKEFFRSHFDGKVVLIGTMLDVEDRKITSKRFATARGGRAAPRAARSRDRSSEAPKFARDSIAGVYIHATAVNNLIRGATLLEFGRIGHRFLAALARRWRRRRSHSLFGPADRRRSPRSASQPRGSRAQRSRSATALVFPLVEPIIGGVRWRSARPSATALSSPTRQAAAAAELLALSGARGDREDDGVEQAARARRRDAQRHRLFLRHRGFLHLFREDRAARSWWRR